MKPWQIVLLAVGIVLVLCCGGGALIGYRAYNGARAVDAEADHFADGLFPKIAKNWNLSDVQDDIAPEWKSQPKEIQDAYMKSFKERLGALKSITPFSAINTKYSSFNGEARTIVVVLAQGTFEKASTRVQLTLLKRSDNWEAGSLKIDLPALAEGKPTP